MELRIPPQVSPSTAGIASGSSSYIWGLNTSRPRRQFGHKLQSFFFLPGASVSSLRTFIREKDILDVDNVDIVLLHVGTNNLSNSVWDWDKKSYSNLYTTVREKYPCSKIIFSAIIPRWDCELLYQASLFYNLQLHSLSTSFWNCNFLDFSSPFSLYDDLFAYDGLHLNFFGKKIFAEEVTNGIVKTTQPRATRKYVPPELKKLWTPRPQKKKKQTDAKSLPSCRKAQESSPPPASSRDESLPMTSSHLPMSPPSSRESQSTHPTSSCQTHLTDMPSSCQPHLTSQTSSRKSCRRPFSSRRKRKRKNLPRLQNGFIVPKYTAKQPDYPPLPPNQHRPSTSVQVFIPYIPIFSSPKISYNFNDLPRPHSAYVRNKIDLRLKRRRMRSSKRKRYGRKMTLFYLSSCCHSLLLG